MGQQPQYSKRVVQQHKPQPLVPGANSYSEAVQPEAAQPPALTLVVSDSMTRSVRVNAINKTLDQYSIHNTSSDRIIINKYPAAHAEQIRHYSQFSLEHEKPDSIVVVASSNDISYDMRKNNADPDIIANRIISIGKDALQYGVKKVFINGIMKRQG